MLTDLVIILTVVQSVLLAFVCGMLYERTKTKK